MIVTAVSRRAGVPAGTVDEIKLAVGEACARAVRVNRSQSPDTPVHLRLDDSADGFTVAVTDGGDPDDARGESMSLFELGDLTDLDPAGDDDQPGLGLALIEGLVDEMDVRAVADGPGTVVTMRWRNAVKPPDAAGPAAV
jgi:anti-sigma regulatory factor (Ser/Thr protein kinase)